MPKHPPTGQQYRLEKPDDWHSKGLKIGFPAALNHAEPPLRHILDQVVHPASNTGDLTSAQYDRLQWLKSLQEYKDLPEEERRTIRDADLFVRFQPAFQASQRQVYDWFVLHTDPTLRYIIAKVNRSENDCGSNAWKALLDHFEVSNENTKSAALVAAVKTVVDDRKATSVVTKIPQLLSLQHKIGRDTKLDVRRILCVLVASVILNDQNAPPALFSIADHALANEDTDLDDLQQRLTERSAVTSSTRHHAGPAAQRGDPPRGCSWSANKKHFVCNKCGRHSTGTLHTEFNCRDGLRRNPDNTTETPAAAQGGANKRNRPEDNPGAAATTTPNRALQFQSKAVRDRERGGFAAPAASDHTGILEAAEKALEQGLTTFSYQDTVYSYDPTTGNVVLPVVNARFACLTTQTLALRAQTRVTHGVLGLRPPFSSPRLHGFAGNPNPASAPRLLQRLTQPPHKIPSGSTPQGAHAPSPTTPLPALGRTAIVDSGAGAHMGPKAAGPTTSTDIVIRGISSNVTNVRMGILQLQTRDAAGDPYALRLPASLVHRDIRHTLVSHYKLLEAGYKVSLELTGGFIRTPDDHIIPLHQRGGLWHIQLDASPARPLTRPAIKLSNRFAPLATPQDNPEIDTDDHPTAPSQDTAAPAPPPTTPANRPPAAPAHPTLLEAHDPVPNDDDLIALLHATYNHCDVIRLLRIVKNLAADPSYVSPLPSATNIKRWYHKRHCASCRIMASRNHNVHPPRRAETREYSPGEFLHIDSLGGVDPSRLTIDGSIDAFCILDDASAARWCIPTPGKSPEYLATILTEFRANSKVPIKRIMADNPLIAKVVRHWCNAQQPPVAFGASPPRHQVSNSRSESNVGYVKTKARTLRQHAGASEYLHIEAARWAATSSNFVPSAANDGTATLSPAHQWPDFPWNHRSLKHDMPWGCRAYVHYGKITGEPDWQRRARPCVFVGWDRVTPSYRLLDLDAREIILAAPAHVVFHPNIFPMLDHKLHGETLLGNLALNIYG